MTDPHEVLVDIAEYRVGAGVDILVVLGISSCVVVAVHDPVTNIGGLAHILLPSPSLTGERGKPGKFPQTAIPLLVEGMVEAGAGRRRLHARLIGGASMFGALQQGRAMPMGERNLAASRAVLRAERIPVSGEATGGDFGRSLRFSVDDGRIEIHAVGRDLTAL
ncbi:MAG TPA: chemotaxis protein CheD [Gemmatimonadales bacterium]|nr:chemotaxis protein CheD [Gemmatimonadales bacterium]